MNGLLQKTLESIATIETDAMRRLVVAGFKPDYVAIRRASDLGQPMGSVDESLVILIAARLAGVRLIDNLEWPVSGRN